MVADYIFVSQLIDQSTNHFSSGIFLNYYISCTFVLCMVVLNPCDGLLGIYCEVMCQGQFSVEIKEISCPRSEILLSDRSTLH